MVPGVPGDAGDADVPGVLSACSIRVKSPGGLAGGGIVAPGGGVGGLGFENTGADGGGVGVEKTGAGVGAGGAGATGAGAGLENAAGTGAAGAEDGFSPSALNICVKLPGEDEPGEDEPGDDAAGGATAGAGANAGGAGADGAGADDGFSLRVPNICVKLPGADEPEEDEPAEDEPGDNESAESGALDAAGAGAIGGAGADAGGSGLASGAPCLNSDASRSSSARGGVGETVPNMPVALDELPPPEPLDPGASGLSKGARGASILRSTLLENNCIVPDSKTTSAWLDSKGQAA